MAGDTRDGSVPVQTPRRAPIDAPELPDDLKAQKKSYELFHSGQKPKNPLPEGAGMNTAGSRQAVPSLGEAIKTVRVEDFKQVHMYPCVRESLMVGIGAGAGMGGVRAVFGSPWPKCANWAVGTFVLGSLATHEICMYKRATERANMKRAVEIMDAKKAEQARKVAEARRLEQERRISLAQAERKAQEGQWKWKFW